MSIVLIAPIDILAHLAKSVRAKRLSLNFSQKSLSDRSGVSFGVLKKFERTGKISLESFVKLAVPLGCLKDFMPLFQEAALESFASLDDILNDTKRMRGRR